MIETLILSLASLGVVYGDIGTSPLYALSQVFFGYDGHSLPICKANVLGMVSLVVWAITIVISFKYVFYVLRADNDGEGGVFALSNLINKLGKHKSKFIIMVSTLLIFAAGLLFGDGIITPAISVTSAVEGLSLVTKAFVPFIIPITIAILTFLFLVQRKGTAKIGSFFGPIIMVWFLAIAILGLHEIVKTPQIFEALNPIYGIKTLFTAPIGKIALILGSVMLTITGGEAMYADMGHFGRRPIRFSWFTIAYPALLLNYLGQGAFLLSGQKVVGGSLFYSSVPAFALIPMIILATAATIIASQALISGAFSLTSQAISLGLMPRLKVIQTHFEHEGQKYIPFVNWALYLGAVLVVLYFKSSAGLAGAYGLAVSGVMSVTTLAMFAVSRYEWHWGKVKTILIFGPLVLIDLTFFLTNTAKFFDGGFIPLAIGFFLMITMQVWSWGKHKVREIYRNYPAMKVEELIAIKNKSKNYLPKSVVVMATHPVKELSDKVPPLQQMFWERYGILPKHLIFLNIKIEKIPYVRKNRFEVIKFFESKEKGSVAAVTVKFGFMEDTNVEKILVNLAHHKEINIDEHPKKWLIHIRQENVIMSDNMKGILKRMAFSVFSFLLKNSKGSEYYFGLGKDIRLSTEVLTAEIS